jgi:hypothetical protein
MAPLHPIGEMRWPPLHPNWAARVPCLVAVGVEAGATDAGEDVAEAVASAAPARAAGACSPPYRIEPNNSRQGHELDYINAQPVIAFNAGNP